LQHYGASFADIRGQLHLLSLAGNDAILGQPDRNGIIQPTNLFTRLLEAACDIKPKLIGIDTSADVYAGEENDRSQVRQFVGLLRHMAIQGDSGLVLNSHPSLTGINTGTGLSGSTGWHNSVRARMYLKPAETDKGDEPDPELRELQFLKNKHGPKAQKILLRWKNGVFVPVESIGSLDKLAADQKAEQKFLSILGKFNQQLRNASPDPSKTYAPTVFAADPEAGGIKARAFEQAMSRLLDANRIHIVEEGPRSHRRKRLAIGPKGHGDGTL
jgi:RecA-family ATPase